MRSIVGKWLDAVAEELSPVADSADSVQNRPNSTNYTNCKEAVLPVRQPISKSKPPPENFSAEDWRTYFDEHAAIAEHDGGLDRAAAERQAFKSTVAEWLNAHPEPEGDTDYCCHCGDRLNDNEALPVLNGPGGHVWLHPRCHQPFIEKRRARAIVEIEAMGLRATE
jgi:hypothetical protein